MTIATDSPATEGQTPNAAPPSADKKPSETDSAKELAAAAAALQQASKSLADAAGKLPEKEPAEKKLVDGTVGFGERSGWNGLLLTFAEKEKKATAKASITTLHGALLVGISLTAPLDSDTRIAAFSDSHVHALPFEAGVSFEYNRMDTFLEGWIAKKYEDNAKRCQRWKDSLAAGSKPKQTLVCDFDSEEFKAWASKESATSEEQAAATPTRVDGLTENPVPRGVQWTLGVETKLGFDRQDVYVDDLATASKSKTATAFKTNAVFRFYPLSWLAIPLRVGLDYENKFKTNSVKRCLTIPSSDPGVTGQSCEDKLFLKNDPGGRTTGTLEAALVGVVPGVTTPLAVGAEVRDHLDVVGSVRQNSLSVSVFATPTSKAVLTRFGLGLGWTHALDDDKDAEIQKGDNWLTPFLLVGGSL